MIKIEIRAVNEDSFKSKRIIKKYVIDLEYEDEIIVNNLRDQINVSRPCGTLVDIKPLYIFEEEK